MGTEQKETSMSQNTKRPATGIALRVAALAGVVALGAAMQGCGGGHSGPATVCDPPQVGATWSIDKRANGAALSCAQANAAVVELTLNNTPYDFQCDAYEGLTQTLPAGNYNADFALIDPNGQVLSQTTQMTITVHSCGVTDLGDVLFDVD
jgi:hypothetical protein